MKKIKKIRRGYTRLPNSVLQVLCFINLRPEVLRTFFAIYRLTFGWGIPERVLSYGQISLITGLLPRNQWRAVKKALELNLIKRYNIRVDEPNLRPIYAYNLNLNAKSWKVPVVRNIQHEIRLFNYLSSKQRIPISSKLRSSIINILNDYPIK